MTGLSIEAVSNLAAIKLCFFVLVFLGLLGIWRKWRPYYFVTIVGIIGALTFYLMTRGAWLPLWGLIGDEITIAAMYEMFAHGPFWSDFAYSDLPPFYPPFYFFLFGQVGKLFDLNGVQLMKLGTTACLLLLPSFIYLVQKRYWQLKILQGKPSKLAWLLSALLIMPIIGFDAVIIKPYEVMAAVGVILWVVWLVVEIKEKTLNTKRKIIFGLVGGLLFMTYYFWFFLAVIGIALFNLINKVSNRVCEYGELVVVGVLTLVFSSPFWLPLAISYKKYGAENWQLGFLDVGWFKTYAPFFELSFIGVILLVGLVSLIIFRSNRYIKILLCLFIAGYVWQIIGLSTNWLVGSPLQEGKPFHIFNRTILVFGFAFIIEYVWREYKQKIRLEYALAPAVLGWLLLSFLYLPGFFVDDVKVRLAISQNRPLETHKRELVNFLKSDQIDIKNKQVLHSSLTFLHAYLPIHDFLYFNQHNSHPAASFSERYYHVLEASKSLTPEEFYDKMKNEEYGQIDLLIFYLGDEENYPIYYHLDYYPNQFREEIVNIPRELVTEDFFDKIFENRDYIVYKIKYNEADKN